MSDLKQKVLDHGGKVAKKLCEEFEDIEAIDDGPNEYNFCRDGFKAAVDLLWPLVEASRPIVEKLKKSRSHRIKEVIKFKVGGTDRAVFESDPLTKALSDLEKKLGLK